MGNADFLIVGAMKAGTTSLSSWLGSQPEVFVPSIKEPNFFSDDGVWSKGVAWYRALLASGTGQIAGEASVAYTDPSHAAVAATRIAEVLPDVKLVFVIRDPIERMRSHYRHEVLRGRERRSLTDALEDPQSPYIERSRYFTCFEPYMSLFPRERICVLEFEDLFGDSEDAWFRLLAFLGLRERPRPTTQLNASADRAQFAPAMRLAWDAGIRRAPRFVPAFVRRAAKPLLFRRQQDPVMETANDAVAPSVVDILQEDSNRMLAWLELPERDRLERDVSR